jgi:hypothetical protein
MVLTIATATSPAFAHDTANHENIADPQNEEQTSGYAFTLGGGTSSLDLDTEGRPERVATVLLRIDKFDASTNYALQYSQLGGSIIFFDMINDIFDCLFSFDGNCDDKPRNTTTLSELSFLYGWRKPDTTYSLGLSYINTSNTIDKQNDYETVGLVGNIRTRLFWIVDGIAHVDLNSEDSFATLYIGYRFD